MTREEILSKAKECVCGQREQDYGSPENNFQLIADLWTDYLGKLISPTDVAMMMALLKIARIRNGGGTGDSFVDLAGYAACGGEINSSRGLRAKSGVIDDVTLYADNEPIMKTCDIPESEKTGLFSDAFEKDNRAGRFCDNCRYEYEVSDGEHCDGCCHNNTSSTISNWDYVPKECSNCLFKDKSEKDYPCNKCILNGHDEFRWVAEKRCDKK